MIWIKSALEYIVYIQVVFVVRFNQIKMNISHAIQNHVCSIANELSRPIGRDCSDACVSMFLFLLYYFNGVCARTCCAEQQRRKKNSSGIIYISQIYSSWELSRCIIIKIVRSRCMNHKFSRWIRARKHAFNSCSICALFSVRKPFVFAAIRLCVRISSLDVQLHYLWKYQRFDAIQCLIGFELVVSSNAGLVFLYGDYHINGVFLIFL